MGKAYRVRRDVIRATGPEAATFLQGQLSQDVEALPAGGSAWSWLLQPTGKVDALVRVTRLADDDWVIDTDLGWGDAVLVRLNRFKLRTKIDLDPVGWECVALVAGALDPADGGFLVPGPLGVELLGPSASDGLRLGPPEEYEALRIAAGWPTMGRELTERTIPAETGLIDRTVSFTKGCYTGQELVARIDSRGSNVARHLRGVRLEAAVPVGTELVVDAKVVGSITSVGHSPELGWVALAYVGRAVSPPTTAAAGSVGARVEVLPLVA